MKMYIENQSKLTRQELDDEVDKILENLRQDAVSLIGYDIGPIDTPNCFHCGRPGIVFVNVDAYKSWTNGEYIQVAFPEMPAERREQMISGTHPECWDEMMKMGEDEEDGDL